MIKSLVENYATWESYKRLWEKALFSFYTLSFSRSFCLCEGTRALQLQLIMEIAYSLLFEQPTGVRQHPRVVVSGGFASEVTLCLFGVKTQEFFKGLIADQKYIEGVHSQSILLLLHHHSAGRTLSRPGRTASRGRTSHHSWVFGLYAETPKGFVCIHLH